MFVLMRQKVVACLAVFVMWGQWCSCREMVVKRGEWQGGVEAGRVWG